ncbi:peptide ABC transporter substrate-binding protein [Blastococcus xanthinilyticus]|uniref:Peptide/nickel transport system substrate-binding protein/oligopeptide transport system substrate-binding protein n=1 Tax=Blastococcus xanthinilyticus TaxID=1564164 RepID=A0A5S5CSP7_9ACTN|nr:ABC transporter substrate-binding protein [Blastococcus xanthinilyticus]TYP86780.1 peptide/nickel transport system substrate-binding protein/oligopeptide transport system substrate-binding protein [Blastococcus xanthinilyticus]
MKLSKRNSGVVATAIAAALLMTACGGDDGGDSGDAAAADGGSYSIYIGEPENPLVPGNTTETEGGQVVDALWTGLVEYDNETNEPVYTGVAESIESDDQQTWTVTLNDGWTFHDGTPVTAQSFVDAWNYTAYSPNAQGNSYFFSNIVGYGDLQAPETGGEPAAQEMSGLRVIDDQTFEVELAAPYAQWPATTGYTAFYPLPEAFYEDTEGFGEQPIGNGPFMADEALTPGQGITLTRFDEYGGEQPANAEQVEFRIYTELGTAYTDLQGGSVDIVDTLPPDAIASAEQEFGERFIETPQGDITSLGFPTYDERFADPNVRKAFSMAIDRQAISDAIFNGTRTPAQSYISPVVPGHREDACEACELNVDEANALLDEAGFDRTQPVDLWFNAGGGHEEWMQAIGNQIRQNLGVEYQLRGDLQFAEYLPLQDAQGMTGPFRSGWIMDYPVAENFLGPLYSTAALPPAGSNVTFYSNPEFDAALAEGNAAATEDESVAAYQAAEDILIEDLPAAPLFYRLNQGAHSENVRNVVIDAYGRIDTAAVEVVE